MALQLEGQQRIRLIISCSPNRPHGFRPDPRRRHHTLPCPVAHGAPKLGCKVLRGFRAVRSDFLGRHEGVSQKTFQERRLVLGRLQVPAGRRRHVAVRSGLIDGLPEAIASATSGMRKVFAKKEYAVGDIYAGDKDMVVIASEKTPYNDILVLEVSRRADHQLAGCRVLLLDAPGNIHSVHNPFQIWTDSYYDVYAALPPILPEGPVALLGLAGGTAARLLLQVWPWLEVHGWELDPAVVAVARNHFGLAELEKGGAQLPEAAPQVLQTREELAAPFTPPAALDMSVVRPFHSMAAVDAAAALQRSEGILESPFIGVPGATSAEGGGGAAQGSGYLVVHTGDALAEAATLEGGFAAILVDLFAEGVVIPELQNVDTWRSLRKRLKPGGRILVNCGAGCVQASTPVAKGKDGETRMRETVAALAEALEGEVRWMRVDDAWDGNVMALTGPLPEHGLWAASLPDYLKDFAECWKPVEELSSSLKARSRRPPQ